jgi:ABC-2 type transport system permease protein
MLSYVGKLMRARWRITWNNIRRASRRRKIGYFFAALGLTVLAVVLVFVSWGVLTVLRRPEVAAFVTPDLIRSIPVFFTSATFLAGLLTNFGVLLQALYLAGDMEFLLAAPIPPRAVFVTKLVQAVLPNFMFMCLFNLPALIGLGIAQGYNITYFIMVPVTLVLLMLAGAGIAAVGVMGVVRLVPARRVAEVLGLVGGVTSILCSQSSQLMRATGVGRTSSAQVLAIANTAAQFNQPYSPLAWPGRALVALGEGQWLAALLLVCATVALTLGAFAVSLVASERLYISGWARTQAGAAPHRVAHVERRRKPGAVRLLPAAVTALVVKDFKLLTRDLRNLSQLITPIILGVVYTFSLVGGTQREAIPSQVEHEIIATGSVGMALFVAWMFAMRLALGGIGMEGKRYWLLKVSPLRAEALLAAKFVVAYLPSLAVGTAFLVATSFVGKLSPRLLPYNWATLAATIAALCALYLAFGTAGANLRWEDPRHITRGMTGCIGWLVGSATAVIVAGVFIGVPFLVSLFGAPEALGQLIGLSVGLALSAGVIAAALLWARGRVALVGEE